MSALSRLRETAERMTGVALRPLAEVTRLEESEVEYRGTQRELQDLAYTVLDYVGGQPQDLRAVERRRLAQQARVIWQEDPQYGGTVNLLNEFSLGRGIPKPQANDQEVQKVIDAFWEDPDNQRVLTTHAGQVRFNTALSLQSNVFLLVYDEGDDGRVRLGLLDHDSVEEAVRDPDNRLRVLYYFTKAHKREWDPQRHSYRVSKDRGVIRYYEEFRNLRDAKDDVANGGQREEPLPQIPDNLIGRGRVMHVSINRTDEQAFGIPEIARTIRWLTAYNDLMRARVDMAKAAASIIAKRKLKGGRAAMDQLTGQALLASGRGVPPNALLPGPRPGVAGMVDENDLVETTAFNLNSGSQGAMQDAQMIRSQYSVGTGWPQSYLGDPTATGLSTATSLELRVLKMVETRQQVNEDVLRAMIDHCIDHAVDKGFLTKFRPMTAEERKREEHKREEEAQALASASGNGNGNGTPPQLRVVQAVDGGGESSAPDWFQVEEPPEGMIERDLSYQVSMPSPLRRAMGDLITAISTIAKTFDPNNTNMELTRLLFGVALGEGLELEDPGADVDRVFPEGYVDPAVAAAMAGGVPAPAPAPGDPNAPAGGDLTAPVGPDGQRHGNADNPYGAPQYAQPPEVTMQQAAESLADARLVTLHTRSGEPLPVRLQEAMAQRLRAMPTKQGMARAATQAAERAQESDVMADELLGPAVRTALGMVNR